MDEDEVEEMMAEADKDGALHRSLLYMAWPRSHLPCCAPPQGMERLTTASSWACSSTQSACRRRS